MYKIGYIDDQPTQYDNYRKKIRRRFPNVDLILFDNCTTREAFLERIYEEQADVLLIDYKMAATFGFDGSTLINYINDQIRDLECFILTGADRNKVDDGLVAERNRYSKDIFDRLYKVLASYGMIEALPKELLTGKFEGELDRLLEIGDTILKKYKEE